MRFPYIKPGIQVPAFFSRNSSIPERAIYGIARVDRRTKLLTQRIKPGEIAVINHADLDGPAAEALVACDVRAVINAARSITGRYPNRGPEVLLNAGIPLYDDAGESIMHAVNEGDTVLISEGKVFLNDTCLATVREMTTSRLAEEIAAAREHLDEELHRFVRNTLAYVEEEQGLLFEPANLPNFRIDLRDKPVLVVVRGEGARQDLATIRSYIRDRRPVMVGVDNGADLLLEIGMTPHIIFGDMDSISDDALKCGAQIIVHAYQDGRCPGKERLDRLGLEYEILPCRGTSEDVILLAAFEKGAELIIAVGTHFNLIDFLDKTRSGMSSTFLVRLRVGSSLIDAKGVSRLYHVSYPLAHFSLMLFSAIAAVTTILVLSKEARSLVQLLLIELQRLIAH